MENEGCPCAGRDGGPKMTRQGFLALAATGLAAAIGAVLSASGLTYFISPAFGKDEENWIDLGPASDIKPGTPVKVDYVERRRDAWVVNEKRSSAWIATADGKEFTAFDPRCTHLGCPYRWDQARGQFLCPCHDAVFSGEGAVVSGPPPRPLDRYSVKIAGGRLLIQPQPQKGA
ncbi:MAG: Rieske (2Fe-2S) protein [Elusimicrobia bacterium]|nr:Rieske (2Fe-2S) protein [Elusimicrobiota bacterium]